MWQLMHDNTLHYHAYLYYKIAIPFDITECRSDRECPPSKPRCVNSACGKLIHHNSGI